MSCDQRSLESVRHSLAHLLAQAVRERFGKDGPVLFGLGRPSDEGMFYEFELPRAIADGDLPWIEARVRELVRADLAFARREVDVAEARRLFAGQRFKIDVIDRLESAGADVVSIYRQGDFEDLCRGPHVARSGEIDPDGFKLLRVAGAYWRGDESRPMLQRIYGVALENRAALEEWVKRREEAERRDHRRLGRDLEWFFFDRSAPGMAYWLPKGLVIMNELIAYWRRFHEKHGYQEIASPLINDRALYERSGHWEHYRDDMFVVDEGGKDVRYGIKPMNCPNAMVVFNFKRRSWRDLPLRLSDCDVLHRNERSGALNGLFRLRRFQQDDAHIFLAEDEIQAEYERIFDIIDHFYRLFGLSYRFRLSLRPASGFLGEIESWDRAESILKEILARRCGDKGFELAPGEGAFYGPKVDILIKDALGREWQMGTIQLDFHLAGRFDCAYDDRDGKPRIPIVIHRVIYGSLERFIAILIEHSAGELPVWIAPVQARVVPVADRHAPRAREIGERMREAGVRVEVDHQSAPLGAKIRDARLMKVPYVLVVGDRELASGQVAVRSRSGDDLGNMVVEEVIGLCGRV